MKIIEVPFGASILEREKAPYEEVRLFTPDGYKTIRAYKHGLTAATVSWKHEGAGGSVYIDGLPFAETMWDENPGCWSTMWLSKRAARALAKQLNAKFVEV